MKTGDGEIIIFTPADLKVDKTIPAKQFSLRFWEILTIERIVYPDPLYKSLMFSNYLPKPLVFWYPRQLIFRNSKNLIREIAYACRVKSRSQFLTWSRRDLFSHLANINVKT